MARRDTPCREDRTNIFLTGFMLSGKSTVGRELARLSGRRLVDTDGLVEASEGRSVSDIFAAAGEPAFREMERSAVLEASSGSEAIVALGGGALLDARNVVVVRRSGLVYYLRAEADLVLARRESEPGVRPLVDGAHPDEILRMIRQREESYRMASDAVLDASLPADELAIAILSDFESRTGVKP